MKTAVVPVKVMLPTDTPLAKRVTLVMFIGLPVPVTVKVTADILTMDELGLVKTIC